MLNETRIAVRGNVATEPVLKVTANGTTVCSFRLAVTARRWSVDERRAVDADTSWFTVTCWRALAENTAASLAKGQGVVVVGRLRVRDFTHEERERTSADLVAEGLGHDLTWGTSAFTATRRSRAEEERLAADQAEADDLAREVAAGAPAEEGGPVGGGDGEHGAPSGGALGDSAGGATAGPQGKGGATVGVAEREPASPF